MSIGRHAGLELDEFDDGMSIGWHAGAGLDEYANHEVHV